MISRCQMNFFMVSRCQMDFLADIFLHNEAAANSLKFRAKTNCIPRAFCFSNLKSGFNFTAVFQIILAKYNKNMVEQIRNFNHAGKDSFNLRVKSWKLNYKNKEPRHCLLNLLKILSINKWVNFYAPETMRKPIVFWWLKGE